MPVGIAHPQGDPPALAGVGDVGDAGGKDPGLAGELLVNGIGDAVSGVTQPGGGGLDGVADELVAAIDIEQHIVDLEASAHRGDVADHQVLHPQQAPVA